MTSRLLHLEAAISEAAALLEAARADAEQRLGVPAGDMAVLDDPRYVAVLDAYGLLVRAANALHRALDRN